MRVALFDDRFDQVYGAQENVLLMTQLGAEAGHETVFITTAEGVLAEAARERGLRVEVVEAPAALRQFEGTSFDSGPLGIVRMMKDLVRYNIALSRAIRQIDADVVVSAAVRPSASLFGTRLLARRPILLYAQNSIPRGALAVTTGLASRRIGLIGPGASATFPGWFRRRFAGKFVPLPSGRDLARFVPPPRDEAEVSASGSRMRVVTVSSITERKGLHVLIASLSLLAERGCEATLTVVGGTTGPVSESYLERLQEQARKAGCDVEFVGWSDDVVPFLAGADVFAMASENEGLPGVLIEAMAMGLPCVTTRAGSAGDVVDEANAGFSTAIGDADALAHALHQLCTDPAGRVAAGQRGRNHVESNLSLRAFQEQFVIVLNTVVGSSRSA